MNKTHLLITATAALAVSVALVGSGAPTPAKAQALSITPSTEVNIGPEFLDIRTDAKFNSAVLRISGPSGYALTLEVPGGSSFVTADLLLDAEPVQLQNSADELPVTKFMDKLPNGTYTYELITFSADGQQGRVTGQFQVEGGAAIEKRAGDSVELETDEGLSHASEPGMLQRMTGAVLDFLVPSAHADSFTEVVTNELCVSFGCVEPESTSSVDLWIPRLKMKRDAPHRILFENTDADWDDWALIVNGGTNGGETNYFAIKNIDADNDPFRIDGNAPEDSLRILESGNVGLGTAAPQGKLHIRTAGGTFFFPPADIRLTNSFFNSIFGTTTVREFQINHSTTGLWFRNDQGNDFVKFNHGAPPNSLVVNSDGNVGVGTGSPSAPLHVSRSDNTANVLVEDTGTELTTMFQLRNAADPKFLMQNTSDGYSWEFRTATTGATDSFLINRLGSGALEMAVDNGGNARFAGTVTANGVLLTSTREAKTDFEPLDEHEILDKLASLEISQWRYKTESNEARHIGPVAEEFHEIFGLSDGKTLNMIDTNGITFAAIKALNHENQRLARQNQELVERLERLELLVSPTM